eukprot:2205724-Lingulodinium_polyedra.AAC.1
MYREACAICKYVCAYVPWKSRPAPTAVPENTRTAPTSNAGVEKPGRHRCPRPKQPVRVNARAPERTDTGANTSGLALNNF